MAHIYLVHHGHSSDVGVGISVGPKKLHEFVRFGNALVEHGVTKAMDVFPIEWEFHEWEPNAKEHKLFDWVSTLSPGIVLSDTSYSHVGGLFKNTPHALIQIDGEKYHWLGTPTTNKETIDLDELTFDFDAPIIKLMPNSTTVCDESFVTAWTNAGLTGAYFSLLA